MKKNKLLAVSFLLVTISTIFLSFTPVNNWGGEGFEVYLNNKLVLQKYGNKMDNVQNLQLDKVSPNDQLIIKYSHCGDIGKNRVITIKDGQNKVLKEFRYKDADKAVRVQYGISCPLKELLKLKKGTTNTFKLYYSASQLPEGRLLTNICFEGQNIARL